MIKKYLNTGPLRGGFIDGRYASNCAVATTSYPEREHDWSPDFSTNCPAYIFEDLVEYLAELFFWPREFTADPHGKVG